MKSIRREVFVACVLAAAGWACQSKRSAPTADEQRAEVAVAALEAKSEPEIERRIQEATAAPLRDQESAGGGAARMKAGVLGKAGKDGKPSTAEGGAARSWFPETFLFDPLVVTDASGAATVPVRVPDRLTTWRVLALAHSRTGAQAGAVTSFLGTRPAYVDPVVPAFLVQGDDVRLPIQLVNTTDRALSGTLAVRADTGTLTFAGGARKLPAQGSTLDTARLIAAQPGTLTVHAELTGGELADAVDRTIEVRPLGRPVREVHTGTLGEPRALSTAGTPGADPATDRIRLRVLPGALGVLRSELAMASARGDLADDAYALLLAGNAPRLLAALGDKADPEALRALAIVTGQRAIRAGRTLDIDRATVLAEPALAHPDNPVLARLGERAVAFLAAHQRPDGTFAGATGWTLQRLLVVTAAATRAADADRVSPEAHHRALAVGRRAEGVFARTAAQIHDGFTAAAILASGAVGGPLADTLRTRVRDAIRRDADGAAFLTIEPGVVRGDGQVPGRVEATALAVLALQGDAKAPLADLGTTLLGGYSVERGWGDGRVNLVAMQAVLALFQHPLPAQVAIRLELDGEPVITGTLTGGQLRDVTTFEAAVPTGLAKPHQWKLTAEPAVPGLGFALDLHSFVAWDRSAAHDGLELALPARIDAVAGKPVTVALTAIAPSGRALHIQQGLPAGVQADTPSLHALVTAGAVTRFVAADGVLGLWLPALAPGKTVALAFRLVPTLAGTLHTGPSILDTGTAQIVLPPAEWHVK
jgi:hypothetical protein